MESSNANKGLKDRVFYLEDILWGLLFFTVSLVFTTRTHDQFTLPKLAALRFCTFFLVVFLVYRWHKGMVKAVPKSVLYAASVLCFWWILSTFFAFHKPTALHGAYGRYNGLWNHLLFLLLFFMTASMPMTAKRLERILRLFVLALIPVSLYAIFQAFKLDPVHWYAFDRPGSTIGQPVILAALANLAAPFALMFFFNQKGKIKKSWWGAVFLVFLTVIIITLSRGVWLAAILSLSIFLLMIIKIKDVPWKKTAVFITGAIVLVAALVYLSSGSFHAVIKKIKSFAQLKHDVAVQSRIYYYDTALRVIKNHPVWGVGFENFSIVYPGYMKPGKNPEETELFRDVLPTKVHNGYLQTASTNGIPALLFYLVLVGLILVLLKTKFKSSADKTTRFISAAFFVSIVGYLIQDIPGWNEIVLTAFFWIILGLSVSFSNQENREIVNFPGFVKYPILVALVIFTVLLSVDSVKKLYTNKLFQESRYLDIQTQWPRIQTNTDKGLRAVPGDFHYEYVAALIYEKRFSLTGDPGAYEKGCRLLEQAHHNNPYNPYILIRRIEFDIEALQEGIIKSTSGFVRENTIKLVQTAKNHPSVYEVISKLRFSERKFQEALENIKKAINLRKENTRYYLIEGDICRALNDADASIDSYKNSLANNSDQKVFSQEWIHAKYGIAAGLIQKNQPDEALMEINSVVERFPKIVDSYLMIGDIYGRMNNLEKAREFFQKALEIDPLNPIARRGLQQIKQILDSGHLHH
jgi:putative inorganic carbon (HCO3(-)) transporter